MAELRAVLITILLFAAIVIGFSSSLNEWFDRVAPSTNQDVNFLGLDNSTRYINDWTNQTQQKLQTDAPVFGSGYVFLQGLYQIGVLITDLPTKVIMPMINAISITLMLPSWFIGFLIAAILLWFVIAVFNVLKGGNA